MTILYESATGFTAQYAKWLSEKLSCHCFSLKEAKNRLSSGEHVLFMGWICAQKIKGLSSAQKRYCVDGVAAVGMNFPEEKLVSQLRESNSLSPNTPLFLLQGGINLQKLHGLKKLIIGFVGKSLAKAPHPSENDKELLSALQNGKDFCTPEALTPIVDWASHPTIL